MGIGGAVTQLPANFTTGAPTTSNTVNLGSSDGTGNCTGNNVHAGTFDNAFWVNGSTSGHMIACGFVNNGGAPADPEMYMFPFASNLITSTGASTFQINTTKGDECSPLTEFYNRTTDRLFFGVGSSDGFLESSTITTSLATPTCTGAPTSTCVTAPERSGRNQRDRDRQPINERRDEHLLLHPGGGVGERPEVQRYLAERQIPIAP